jgi:outer membrane protein assembly factor BamB
VDLDAERAVWGLRGVWRYQHEARVLASGRILLFDNLGKKHHSRVLEVDPLTAEVLWSYEDSEPGAFESLCCGANQRLENGNTLITDAARGRAFELDPTGRLVWEYWSPYRVLAGDGTEKVATLFEVRRLPGDWLLEAG